MAKSISTPEKTVARFWSRVNKDGPVPEQNPELGPCWEWMGCRRDGAVGYGIFSPYLRSEYAHRYSFKLAYGDIPEGSYVCHHCDNNTCVRPSHLYAGTPQQNVDDAKARGRFPTGIDSFQFKHLRQPVIVADSTDQRQGIRYGSANHQTKLTAEEVRVIRAELIAETSTIKQLAERFGVARNAIRNIAQRRAWAWLD